VIFRQILHDDLGCASYVVADGGAAAVVDPKWDIAPYLALAGEQGFEIDHVLETHNHADHVSGRGRLHRATGAAIHVSAEAGVEYRHEPLRDGDVIEVGRARIRALATPGHRPEHLAFVIEDGGRGGAPWAVLTGDSLLVGDLARPDLAVDPEEGAQLLHGSLRQLLQLPDFVEVWPGHIGGSLCGGAGMSEKPVSTVGFERRFNRFLGFGDAADFVRELLAEVQPQPPNFERVVELNRGPLIEDARPPEGLAPARVADRSADGVLLDGRSPREFDAVHIPGSINVPMTGSGFGTRAAWVVEPDAEVVVLGASDQDARRMADLLAAVGIARVAGYAAGGITPWQETGGATRSRQAIDPAGLAEQLRADGVVLLDVREDAEWRSGHVDGSLHVPYHELGGGLPADVAAKADGRPLAIACSAGVRSSIAASLLERHGLANVRHVVDGGVQDLEQHGIALVAAR
jgi:glyoxylase-like metal-dependent hydrolase (beta-lactamase superfamily II)/rhodanese-related sulfurtransferase